MLKLATQTGLTTPKIARPKAAIGQAEFVIGLGLAVAVSDIDLCADRSLTWLSFGCPADARLTSRAGDSPAWMLASRGDQPGHAKVGTVGQPIIDVNNVGAPTLLLRVAAGSRSLIRRLTSFAQAIACETPWGDFGVDLAI